MLGSDYSDSFCNVSNLIREIVSLTGLDYIESVPDTVLENKDSIAVDSSVPLSGEGDKTDGEIVEGRIEGNGEVEGEGEGVEERREDGQGSGEVEDEDGDEEDMTLDAVTRLIDDVSPILTNIDDLPGKESYNSIQLLSSIHLHVGSGYPAQTTNQLTTH